MKNIKILFIYCNLYIVNALNVIILFIILFKFKFKFAHLYVYAGIIYIVKRNESERNYLRYNYKFGMYYQVLHIIHICVVIRKSEVLKTKFYITWGQTSL